MAQPLPPLQLEEPGATTDRLDLLQVGLQLTDHRLLYTLDRLLLLDLRLVSSTLDFLLVLEAEPIPLSLPTVLQRLLLMEPEVVLPWV